MVRAALIDKLAQNNPGWRTDYEQQDSGTISRRVENLRILVQDPKLMGRAEFQGVANYLSLRDQVVMILRARAAQGGSGVLSANTNLDLRQAMDTGVSALLEQNLPFGNTYYRYLQRDADYLTAHSFIAGEAKQNNG